MSIREKLLDFKRRLSDRKMYSIVIVFIGAIAVWGISQYRHASDLRQELDNQYNRAFYDMVGYVNNVEVLLVKSMITSTPEKTAQIMQEAWRQSNLAQANLGQLPITPDVLANTSKFLTQVGDLAYSLNNQNMSGNSLSDEQYNTIQNLHGFALNLENSLNDLQGDLTSGRLKWKELSNKGTNLFSKTSANMPVQKFEDIDKTFQDYPTLIYDGPFSDHLVTAEPRGVTGEKIDAEQGKQKVIQFFGEDKVNTVELSATVDTQPISTYAYTVTFKNVPDDQTASISVTQKGGHILWMLYNRASEAKNVDVNKAKLIGREFLKSRGINNMIDTYYTKEDNTATINYAYQQNDVTVYPDLIKLKIALDNGEIIGYEAKGYLSAHTERQIPAPKISEEEAKKKISKKMQLMSSGIALIPTDYKTEIFCYEFKGMMNDKYFLVYINAENGREENVLMIIDSENGILTM